MVETERFGDSVQWKWKGLVILCGGNRRFGDSMLWMDGSVWCQVRSLVIPFGGNGKRFICSAWWKWKGLVIPCGGNGKFGDSMWLKWKKVW